MDNTQKTENQLCKTKSLVPAKDISQNKSAPNQNSISINLGLPGDQAQVQSANTREITLQPNPLKLSVSTDTDWPTIVVGTSSVFVAFVIALLSYHTQKNQVKANAANLRHQWIEELRNTAAKFVEQATLLSNKIFDDHNYLKGNESTELYSSLLYSQVKISLMLDKSKRRNKKVIDIAEKTLGAIKNLPKSGDELVALLIEFEEVVSEILESAWQDIKFDLNPTLIGRVRRSLKKQLERSSGL